MNEIYDSSVESVREAREFLEAWLSDDSELPLPSNTFGYELAWAVALLVQITGEKP